MKSLLLDKEFPYDGTQLRSLFGYLDHKIQGDSAIAWIGSCDISFEHMVDGEDLNEGATIAGSRMLHFIIEKFHVSLIAGVALQRLFASICIDLLRELAPKAVLHRSGDDIYVGEGSSAGKMSISIATLSPMSCLIHFAMNCSNAGTPVKTASFEDLSIDPRAFAAQALDRLTREIASIEEATVKVRWVN